MLPGRYALWFPLLVLRHLDLRHGRVEALALVDGPADGVGPR
jgi:hypothetical protein